VDLVFSEDCKKATLFATAAFILTGTTDTSQGVEVPAATMVTIDVAVEAGTVIGTLDAAADTTVYAIFVR
jgi:hypothetical protein